MKAVTRLRSMLKAEESESTTEIRQNVCCQLAEVLISNCSNTKYIRPDLDAMTQTKRSKHNFSREHQATYGGGSVGSGSAPNDNPWKPLRQSIGFRCHVSSVAQTRRTLLLSLC